MRIFLGTFSLFLVVLAWAVSSAHDGNCCGGGDNAVTVGKCCTTFAPADTDGDPNTDLYVFTELCGDITCDEDEMCTVISGGWYYNAESQLTTHWATFDCVPRPNVPQRRIIEVNRDRVFLF